MPRWDASNKLGFFHGKALPGKLPASGSGTPEWPKQQVLGLFALVAEDVDLKSAGETKRVMTSNGEMGWGYTDKTHTKVLYVVG